MSDVMSVVLAALLAGVVVLDVGATVSGRPRSPGAVRTFHKVSAVVRLALAVGLIALLVLRSLQIEFAAIFGRYNSMVLFAALLLVVVGVMQLRDHVHPLMPVVLGSSLVALVLVGIASSPLVSSQAGPVMPALRSVWLPLHIFLAFLGEVFFTVAFVSSVTWLVVSRRAGRPPVAPVHRVAQPSADKASTGKAPTGKVSIGGDAPAADARSGADVISAPDGPTVAATDARRLRRLDQLTYRFIAVGYGLFTVGGLIFGAIWAQVAWGRYWGWDPKETWALVTWLVYSLYLHARLRRWGRGATAHWISVAGYATALFTLFGVNILYRSLHAY